MRTTIKMSCYPPPPPPAAFPSLSMGNTVATPTHGAKAPHKSFAGTLQWVYARRPWFPWLTRRNATHNKIERGTGPWS
jgi:hypothetical protein